MRNSRQLPVLLSLIMFSVGCVNRTQVVAHKDVLSSARDYAITNLKWDTPFVDEETVITNDGILVTVYQVKPVESDGDPQLVTSVLMTFDFDGNFVSGTYITEYF